MNKTRLPMLLVVVMLTLTLAGMALAADNLPQKVDPPPGNTPELGTAPDGWVRNAQPEALWPGPDGYGYAGSSVTFNWVDITATGTPIVGLLDDNFVGPFPIGFSFSFYGTPWTEFYASSNGFISFGAGDAALTNQCPLPDPTLPENIIAMLWDDLDFGTSGNAYYQTFNPCPTGGGQCLVVEYYNTAHYGGVPGSAGTWEAVLFGDGSVMLQYLDAGLEEGSSSTEGIEEANTAANYGLTYACNTTDSLSENTAISFRQATGITILPESIEAQGCGYVPQQHVFNVLNFTGHNTTVNLDYIITEGIGTCTGPSSVDIAVGGSAPITVTLTPMGGVGDLVRCEVFAADALDPFNNDTAEINKRIVTGMWQQISDEPSNGRMDNVVAGYNGYVYSITGYGDNADVRRYDPLNNSWAIAIGSAPPFGVNYARSGCTAGNTVYMYGDSATSGFTGLWSYNIDTNVWAQVTPSGTPPAQTGIWAPAWVRDPISGYCLMTGGATTPGTGTLATVYVYDPNTNAWLTPLPDFSTVRDFHAAFVYNRPSDGHHLLCVAGGNSGGAGLTSTQCFDFNAGIWDAENADMGALPYDLWGMGYVDKLHIGIQHQLWLTGGVYGGLVSNTTRFFDVDTGTWVDGGPLVSGGVYRTSAVTVNNEIFKLGGAYSSLNYTGLADRHVQLACLLPPIISVLAPPLHATQPPDSQTTIPMQICNTGGAPLNWFIMELPVKRILSNEPTVALPSEAIVNSIQSDRTTPFEGVFTQVGAGLQGSAGSSGFGNPEAVLWDNGPLVTHPGGGFGGADASTLQSALGLYTYGFGHQLSANNHMADDFVITDPNGWSIDQITFFAYQTGSPTSPSPLTAVYYQIWDGPPNDPGSTLVFGDLTTNRLVSSTWTNIYRVIDTNLLDATRPIFADVASAGVSLPAGTYWIEWMSNGNVTYSGPWVPPISHLGQTITGNAMQYLGGSSAWQPALDGSNQQGMPFIIEGSVISLPDIPWLSESSITGTTPAGGCSPLDVNFDSTGLAFGDYSGGIQINHTDFMHPSIILPVTLTVQNYTFFLPTVIKH